MIEVTVIGGYLGAGKTTLVNHILRTARERIAILVNDFGAVSIDEALIEARAEQMVTLTNGCICCSMVDGLAAALEQIRSLDPSPNRLVIETSGVAYPGAVAAYAHGGGLRLEGVVTMADAETIRARTKNRYVGDLVVGQLRQADLIVLNKTDLIDPTTAAAVRRVVGEASGGRRVIEAVQGVVPLELLLGIEPGAGVRPHGRGGDVEQHGSSPFVSWARSFEHAIDPVTLVDTIAGWPAAVVRVKGIVNGNGRRVVVQRVGIRVHRSDEGPWLGGPGHLVAIAIEAELDRPLDQTLDASLDALLRRSARDVS